MRYVLTIIWVFALSACGISIDGYKYVDQGQRFDLFRFFEGDVTGYGIVQDRDGNLLQRFTVNINGTVNNQQLTLDETFTYSFGEGVETRTWTIDQVDAEVFSGSANDIEGPAEGVSHGNAFNWVYKMDLPVGDTTYNVKFDDWIWAFDDATVVNRSYIKKFGVSWAEVTIFMQKQ